MLCPPGEQLRLLSGVPHTAGHPTTVLPAEVFDHMTPPSLTIIDSRQHRHMDHHQAAMTHEHHGSVAHDDVFLPSPDMAVDFTTPGDYAAAPPPPAAPSASAASQQYEAGGSRRPGGKKRGSRKGGVGSRAAQGSAAAAAGVEQRVLLSCSLQPLLDPVMQVS